MLLLLLLFHWKEFVHCYENVDTLSVFPVSCESNVKDQGKTIRWTREMDSCLSAVLVQQIKLGNRSKFDYKLKPAAFEAAVLAINEKFKLDLMKVHVKTRLKTWKKQYDILKELLGQSGFQWDEERKMVIAKDNVWNEYIKINPDARVLKGRVIQNLIELCIIIGHCDPADSSTIGAHANMGLIIDDNIMEAPETRYLGTDITKDKGKCVTWTYEMDNCLTEQLVKEVMLGNKLEKNLKTSAYIVALTALNERFCLSLTIENIKTRLKTLKKHVLVKEMISPGRFLWDEGRKMVVGKDSDWKEYIKKHPEARHLQARRIENYHELGIIFGNGHVGGNSPEIDVNLTPNFEMKGATPALIFRNEEMRQDYASDEAQSSSEQTRARPLSSLSKQPSKRRRTTGDVMVEMMSVMAADIGRIADALTECSNKTACLEEVVEKVQNIPDFDDDLIIEACEYLCFDEKRALMFLKLDERLRKKWLLKRLRC